MGCDIHLYVEKRVDGVWVSVDKWSDPHGSGMDVVDEDSFYSNRNYEVFAILAGVRNSDGYVPICEPRGFPGDASPEVVCRWASHGEHTPGWLTLAELLAFDWTQVATRGGTVGSKEFARWNRWGRGRGRGPTRFSQGVSGPAVVHVSLEEMEAITAAAPLVAPTANTEEEWGGTYCRVDWQEPYFRSAHDFLAECVPRLLRVGAPDDVRIVFWFDS